MDLLRKQIDEILIKIEYIEKIIDANQQNIQFTLGLTWAIVGVAIAVLGAAAYFLIKMWVNKRVEVEMQIIKKKINNKLPQMNYGEFVSGETITRDSVLVREITVGFKPDKVKFIVGTQNLTQDKGAIIEIDQSGLCMQYNFGDFNGVIFSDFQKLSRIFKNKYIFGKSIVIEKAEIIDRGFKIYFKNLDTESDNTLNVRIKWSAYKLGNFELE